MAETLAGVQPYPAGSNIIQPLDNPSKRTATSSSLRQPRRRRRGRKNLGQGRLALSRHSASCSKREEKALKAILNGTVKKGHVIVIRSEGPKGGPGMREMLSPTAPSWARPRQGVALHHGRTLLSGGSHGFVVGHITPEAYVGGPIALVKNGDTITIDAEKRKLTLEVSSAELKKRRKTWKKPAPRYTRGVLAKYASAVTSATLGAVTDLGWSCSTAKGELRGLNTRCSRFLPQIVTGCQSLPISRLCASKHFPSSPRSVARAEGQGEGLPVKNKAPLEGTILSLPSPPFRIEEGS
jgi:dihydroxy-acid dehydratase